MVHWKTESTLDADPGALLAAALDPATLLEVPRYMPLVGSATRVSREELPDGTVRVTDRYEPGFDPPAFARGLSREMLGWDLVLTWNLPARAATFVVDPHVPAKWKRYADVKGTYHLEARGGGRTARVLEGDVAILVPLVGPLAERFAVRELTRQFEGEARLLEAHARRRAA